ncbi:MAG: zinc-dependent metalloprotease [Oligoflexia bacterium]|nr:zinc-dependent metalloprotease [Oligoflexia bacterium]
MSVQKTADTGPGTVSVVTTVDRKALLEQEFLYGADLQYSSFYDAESDLYLQSVALGHFPVRFRIAGQELQLVVDSRYRFPSDVNHPEKLISRFEILEETESTLKVSGANSSVFLGMTSRELGAEGQPADHWVRSFESAERGTLLLQQTSVLFPDGSIGEFLESVFPRASLAPSANFQKFEMDPSDPIGGSEGMVARFRFLGGEKIHEGEKALTYAQHFDPPPGGTIDWHVTRNIPDEYLEPVKAAVEGWNRYFESFSGIARPALRFLGRLPEGIHLGDPRYNVINWDSRRVAGAAYESQAVDPLTGKQSHSLIYLPAAWLEIGKDYWQDGLASDPVPAGSLRGKRRSSLVRTACARELRDGAALAASGRLTRDEVEAFAIQLLKGTLFHELGHALGLAHNFKGSLAFDRSKPGAPFSTSIMDYNDFELERGAFDGLLSATGPLLEYDRQALSALYNQGRDFDGDSDPLPTCNDEEADQEEGGVDPLCIRYDAEKDPTLAVETSYQRLVSERLEGDVSLAQALLRVPGLTLTEELLSAATDKKEFEDLATRLGRALKGTLGFYLVSGKTSFARSVRTNLKSLLEVSEGILPEGYDLQAMRERAFTGVQRALALRELPSPVRLALLEARSTALLALASTPYLRSLSPSEAKKQLGAAEKKLEAIAESFAADPSAGLAKARAAVLGALARHEAVPYFFGKLGERPVDFEALFVGLLSEAIPSEAGRTAAERKAAVKALATYAGRLQGDGAIEAARLKLQAERAAATSNEARELAQELLKALAG